MESQEQKGNMKLFTFSKMFYVAHAMAFRELETKAWRGINHFQRENS